MFSAILTAIGSSLLFLLLHIQNGSGFPKPLTAKEEREQLEKMAHDFQPMLHAALKTKFLCIFVH